MLPKFLIDDSGATAIEYGLIAALLAIATITGLTSLGGDVSAIFTNVGTKVQVTP